MPKVVTKKVATVKGFAIPAYTFAGTESSLDVPKEVFGQKVNTKLLAQAIRIYMTNEKNRTASTKNRGEVHGTTHKMYRQKGTGRARHGAATAPIFVGGGVAFGPRPRVVRLDLPKKMKKAALISALSSKFNDKKILGLVDGEKSQGKTKQLAILLQKINQNSKGKNKSTLIITSGRLENLERATKNLPKADIVSSQNLNAYEVIKHEVLVITKDAIGNLLPVSMKEQAE